MWFLIKSNQNKMLAPNALWFTYQNLKSCKSHEKNETKNIRLLIFNFSPFWCFLFFMGFVRFQILISEPQSIWRKHLVLIWLYQKSHHLSFWQTKRTRLLGIILMAISTGPPFPGVFQFQDHSSWLWKFQMRCQTVTINKTIIKTSNFFFSLTVKGFFKTHCGRQIFKLWFKITLRKVSNLLHSLISIKLAKNADAF